MAAKVDRVYLVGSTLFFKFTEDVTEDKAKRLVRRYPALTPAVIERIKNHESTISRIDERTATLTPLAA